MASAGVLFTNGSLVLAGVQTPPVSGVLHQQAACLLIQKKNGNTILSGFGGKSEPGESVSHTAAREVLEEIFDISPNLEQITKVEFLLLPLPFVSGANGSEWSFFVADFVCLTQIYNSICLPSEQKTTEQIIIYLLFHRQPKPESEILKFVLLPAEQIPVDSDFLSDIELLK